MMHAALTFGPLATGVFALVAMTTASALGDFQPVSGRINTSAAVSSPTQGNGTGGLLGLLMTNETTQSFVRLDTLSTTPQTFFQALDPGTYTVRDQGGFLGFAERGGPNPGDPDDVYHGTATYTIVPEPTAAAVAVGAFAAAALRRRRR
jgi:MYXO-CTERM domain-containing protein